MSSLHHKQSYHFPVIEAAERQLSQGIAVFLFSIIQATTSEKAISSISKLVILVIAIYGLLGSPSPREIQP
jgi:hypothetical protein